MVRFRLLLIFAFGASVFAFAGNIGHRAFAGEPEPGCPECSGIDDRIEQLDRTSALYGVRGVSLSVSGHVQRTLMFWDDGQQRDVYVVDNDNSSSRMRFRGQGRVNADLSAGFFVEIEFESASTFDISQIDDDGRIDPRIRHTRAEISSGRFGTLWLGHTAPATYIMMFPLILGTPLANYADPLTGNGFLLRRADISGEASLLSATRAQLRAGLDTSRRDIVRYTSPTVASCYVAAAWGENDLWDVALWCQPTIGRFETLIAAGYLEGSEGAPDNADLKGQITIRDRETGLFGHITGIHRSFHGGGLSPVLGRPRGDEYYYYLQAGIEQNWSAMGKTSIFGEFGVYSDFAAHVSADAFGVPGGEAVGSEVEIRGAGIVQHIDAAASELYIAYRHEKARISVISAQGTPAAVPLEDFDYVLAGMRLKF